ncbi:MAG: hypothetical protein D6749_04660 [Chloroflexota bacterium]|nr:MAG: hypothetical protein D6749_04660 [Chloroflexota bacterium]
MRFGKARFKIALVSSGLLRIMVERRQARLKTCQEARPLRRGRLWRFTMRTADQAAQRLKQAIHP